MGPYEEMSLRRAALVLGVAGAMAALAPAQPPPQLPEARYELSFELEAEVTSRRVDAELVAGARLLMTSYRSAGGELSLSLERVLEAPWKLYHVNPAGPFGEETKLGAVITLPDASWKTLEARRREARRLAMERHAAWAEGRTSTPALDGAFAFVVIGPSRDRFEVQIEAGGRVREVRNRLTDRWLSGPFDRFIGAWGASGEQPDAPEGYWFWNQGESEPFDYEPHTYHALAEAVRLLDLPLPADRSAAVDWPTAVSDAHSVAERLVPKTAGLFGEGAALSASVERREEPEGRVLVRLAAEDGQGTSVRRETVFLPGESGVLSDRIEVAVAREKRSLRLVVGYEPFREDG